MTKARCNTIVGEMTVIHDTAFVAPINVVIGDRTEIGPGAVILENTRIGSDTFVGPGAVVGACGIQITCYREDGHDRAEHLGNTFIGNDSFIGANSVVVRGLAKSDVTIIGDGVTIGNLVNIGHNCVIKNGALILPMAVICGSSVICRKARISPGVVVTSSVVVGEGAHITLGSVVSRDVPAGERVTGNFAVPHEAFMKYLRVTFGSCD